MPTRQLKPGLLTSLRYNRCSWPAQNLYTRLLALADDYARFDAHPLIAGRAAFPYGDPKGRPIRDEQIEAWLTELENCHVHNGDLPLLTRYRVNGVPYLVLHRWTERVRSEKSRYPAPPFAQVLTFASKSIEEAYRRQQMPATAGSRAQLQAAAAVPDPAPTSTTSQTNGLVRKKEKVRFATPEAEHAAQKSQFASNQAAVRELEGIPEEERTVAQGQALKQARWCVKEIQKKQRRGDFTLVETGD